MAVQCSPVVERAFYSTLAKLAVPLALQSLISYGVGFADNFMIGSLGDKALSGVFISNQVVWILQMLSGGIGAALVILVAQYLGKGDTHRAKVVITIAIKIAFFSGLIFTAIALLFPRHILGLFSKDKLVIDEGMKYFLVVAFSYALIAVNGILLAAMRCAHNTKVGFYSSLTGFIVSVSLNWVLIFGNLGFPALGVRGAAISTIIARMLEFSVSFFYMRFKDRALLFRLSDLRLWDKLLFLDFFKYGTPVIIGSFTWGIAGVTQVVILGKLGTEVLAANTIAANLQMILGVVVYAVAGASSVMIGRAVGSGNVDKVKAYARVLQIIFLLVGVVSGTLIFVCKDLLLSLAFKNISPEAYGYAVQFLTVFSITIVGTAYQMSVLTGIVRAGGAVSFVLINDLIWVWCVVVPSALLSVYVFHFPPVVVFACLKCDQILKCTVAYVKLRRWNWMKKLTREG